jgi:Protein of unknown function (DUF3293)
VPPVSADPWAAYERTVVDIWWPEGGTLRVRAGPEADAADWPWPDTRPVHVLTAWDPGTARPGPQVNRVRQAALEADLLALGLPLLTAAGVDPVARRRDEGVAVRGAPESDVLALGARYCQDAVFAWTPQDWSIVGCESGRRLASGWSLQRLQPGFRFSPGPDAPI